jgi:hypothetical protein
MHFSSLVALQSTPARQSAIDVNAQSKEPRSALRAIQNDVKETNTSVLKK